MTQSLLFYWSLKHFHDETRDSKLDKEFFIAFEYTTEEEWATIQELVMAGLVMH